MTHALSPSAGLILAALLVPASASASEDRANRFNDPFLQVTGAIADCPPQRGPMITEAEMRAQSHVRAERGTSCFIAGRCRLPNAYLYDQEIIPRVKKAILADGRFAKTSLWVQGERRWVWLKGCVNTRAESETLEKLVRNVDDVEAVINELAALGAGAPSARTPPRAPAPCESRAESHQFDFWLGEWTVMDQDQPIAVSRIVKAASGCILFENYEQADGFSGKSINFFDPLLGRWRQTWADSTGNASEFVGTYRDKAMRFEGETHIAGRKVLRRMTLFDLGNGVVRQLSERSLDEGHTWGPHYDFRYVRKQ